MKLKHPLLLAVGLSAAASSAFSSTLLDMEFESPALINSSGGWTSAGLTSAGGVPVQENGVVTFTTTTTNSDGRSQLLYFPSQSTELDFFAQPIRITLTTPQHLVQPTANSGAHRFWFGIGGSDTNFNFSAISGNRVGFFLAHELIRFSNGTLNQRIISLPNSGQSITPTTTTFASATVMPTSITLTLNATTWNLSIAGTTFSNSSTLIEGTHDFQASDFTRGFNFGMGIYNVTNPGSLGTYSLDALSITAIPEPSVASLLLGAFSACAAGLRRRKRPALVAGR